MWIKICGITSLEDAQLAIAAGADAVGFVFAASPRRVSVETVRAITQKLPQSVEKIGVFVDATFDAMVDAIQTAGLTGAQLHGEDSQDMAQSLRDAARKISRDLRVVRVLHYGSAPTNFRSQLRALRAEQAMDAVLLDTRVAGKQGGTGVSFDWQAAREGLLAEAPHLRLIAAGGLHAENVQEAISILRPWGVDVSSGVEMAPGRKDPARVTAFIRAARAASQEFEEADVPVQSRNY